MNRISFAGVIGIVMFVGTGLMAQPTVPMGPCDELYAKRGTAIFESVKCYEGLLANAGADKKRVYERIFIALSSVVNTQPKTDEEWAAIEKGLATVEKMKDEFESTADYQYWNAVWVSFQSIVLDRGRVLPRHMFGSLKRIQAGLRKAIDLDPTVHLYGPHRVLGLMHTQMPGIVGGDKALAEKLLKVAFEKAPNMSANQLAYGNILIVNGKYAEAEKVLSDFLAMSDDVLNPYPAEPLRSMLLETNLDRQRAKERLDDLRSNR